MRLSVIFFIILLMGMHPPASAQGLLKSRKKAVEATDLLKALSGNTLSGEVDGIPFWQYFSPTGKTIWQPAAGEDVMGKWRVGSNGNLCILWDGAVESCYVAYKHSTNTIRWEHKNTSMVSKRLSDLTIIYKGNATSLPPPPEEVPVKKGFFYEQPAGDFLRGGLAIY